MTDRQSKKSDILHAALEIACFEGWSDATLSKAAVQAGYPPLTAKQLFPDGVKEVLACFSDELNQQLQNAASMMKLDEMRVHERIAALVQKRLELADPYKEAVRRASAYMAMPWHYASLTQAVWDICDVIWRLAGDTSTDHNYYTKRSLLAKVYVSTSLVWLQDDSGDYTETWLFLERRIADVLKVGGQLGKMTSQASKFVENMAEQFTSPKRYRTKRR